MTYSGPDRRALKRLASEADDAKWARLRAESLTDAEYIRALRHDTFAAVPQIAGKNSRLESIASRLESADAVVAQRDAAVKALRQVLVQWETMLPEHGLVHDERSALIAAHAAIAQCEATK